MLDLLARILGPNWAVSAYVALKRFGLPVGLLMAFGVVFGIILTVSNPDRMEHMAYLQVPVVEITPLTQDPNGGVFVDVQLPDGAVLRLTETEGAIARELENVACLEQQRDTTSGDVSYRLRRALRCAG